MFKRLVRRAIAARRVTPDEIAIATDDALSHELLQHDQTGLARALRERRLAKRALDIPGTELPAETHDWPSRDPDLLERVEERLAREVGLGADQLFLDFPSKPEMFDVSLPGLGSLGLPRVAGELHRSAQRLRVFVLEHAEIPARAVIELVTLPREEVAATSPTRSRPAPESPHARARIRATAGPSDAALLRRAAARGCRDPATTRRTFRVSTGSRETADRPQAPPRGPAAPPPVPASRGRATASRAFRRAAQSRGCRARAWPVAARVARAPDPSGRAAAARGSV